MHGAVRRPGEFHVESARGQVTVSDTTNLSTCVVTDPEERRGAHARRRECWLVLTETRGSQWFGPRSVPFSVLTTDRPVLPWRRA
jgi:hypothetical protein